MGGGLIVVFSLSRCVWRRVRRSEEECRNKVCGLDVATFLEILGEAWRVWAEHVFGGEVLSVV